MTGPTAEMSIIEDFIKKARYSWSLGEVGEESSTTPAESIQCRSCSVHQDCPSDGDYRCVANVKASTSTRALQGCCKLDTWSASLGRRLLGSSPQLTANGESTMGASSDHVCACNCTYASPACCGADDGIVSEPPPLNVEVLAPPNATTCCNKESGLFEAGTVRLKSTFC